VDLNLDGNRNEILDLGPQATWQKITVKKGDEFLVDSVRYLGGHREGYPVRSIWGRIITGYDAATNKHTRSNYSAYQGPPLPTFNASLANTITFGRFRLYGLVSMERGAVFSNSDRPYRIRQGGGDEFLSLLDENGNPTTASDSLKNYFTLVSAYDSRDNIRIRELSLTYTVPEEWLGALGLGRTTLTASAQNVYWWDDCHCMDPNMSYRGGASFSFSGFLAMPQPRKFLFSIRTSF